MKILEMAESSWIEFVERKDNDVVLQTKSGYTYLIKRVPDDVWLEWNIAPSAGAYFVANIRNKYQINKVVG